MPFKNIINTIGSLLAIGGVAFVINKLWIHGSMVELSSISRAEWLQLFLLCILYGILNITLSFAWQKILLHLGRSAPLGWTVWIYGISQMAKYVPGNIFQFASRQLIGNKAGISHVTLSQSSIYELGLIALSGVIFLPLILPLLYSGISTSVGIILFFLATTVVFLFLRYLLSKHVAVAFLYHLLFLTFYGLIFYILVSLVEKQESVNASLLLPLIGAAVVAWLVGLVTPGAPAGLGVREAILLLLLSKLFSQGHLEFAVVLGRIVTASGDLFFYFATYAWGRARKMAIVRL